MKFFKLSLIIFAITSFLVGCNSGRINDVSSVNPIQTDRAQRDSNTTVVENLRLASEESPFWGRENLDLPAVGKLLEKARNAEDFERLLNARDGVNNLDLNRDGYADYISVAEYDNSYDNQRGFTLFDRFGVDEIQEIARIIFDRDRLDAPGARILLTGNERLYGDGYNYETNWLDKSMAIASWLFQKRDSNYQSPYYYENYPSNYETYRVVETPVYVTRVKEYYSAPVFVKTDSPAITQIKIKSPYNGRTAENILSKLAKPTKEQDDFRKNNPNKPEFVEDKSDKPKEDFSKNKKENSRNDFEKLEKPGKGNKDDFEIRNKPERIEREDVKPNKQNKEDKQNRGNGDGNGNGKGNGGGKGNGKGKSGKN